MRRFDSSDERLLFRLAKYIEAHGPAGFARASLECKWFHEELARDAPAGWQNLYVEGEVWDEDGITNVKTVYYYTLPNDAERRQFTASNVWGPMNAIKALQRQMADEGNAWRKVQLEYTAGTSRMLIDTQ